jgi:hypothetical protein
MYLAAFKTGSLLIEPLVVEELCIVQAWMDLEQVSGMTNR